MMQIVGGRENFAFIDEINGERFENLRLKYAKLIEADGELRAQKLASQKCPVLHLAMTGMLTASRT